ncbi:MAG: 2-oxoglutarate-dependent dioxygenase [Methylophilaceae bacterium]|nr:2-oxoglutarate-dependent dioxygenase [Methylophilaceae bacterium]
MQENLSKLANNDPLTTEWKQWINDNLARGCTPEALIEIMTEQNFDPIFARTYIHWLCSSRSASAAASEFVDKIALPDASYIYETPRLPQTGSIIKTADRDVRVTLRMTKPVVALFDNLFTSKECDELIRLASIKLERSTIVDPKTGQEEIIQERSSYGTYFNLNENKFIARLDRRIATVMNWPMENGEGIQILNYKAGAEYKAHFDYFPPGDPGSAAHIAKGGQRVSTLVMYLNDVEAGGETALPELGLTIAPKKGSALYFEYCNSLNQVDPLSLHSGMPVIAGEKWIATKWMRQNRYG